MAHSPTGTRLAFVCLLAACLLASCAVAARADVGPPPDPAAGAEFFEAKIRPLLAEHCYACHSASAPKIKAKLRVDSREGLLQGGEIGPALVPGEPGRSRLIEAVSYQNPDLQMPPKSRLSAEQVADLAAWVKRGAPWPAAAGGAGPVATAKGPASAPADPWGRRLSHWAWQPVRPPSPPAIRNTAWPRGPVDRFILARLEAEGLAPAPPADRRALARRASFALVGLPPSPEEVEAFVADPSPDAYEKLVDHLLASPHFGERWARHWMDLVRYSDTLGNEADLPIPNAWRYRDYLIRAFNADLPYDQLVIEHVAGDLLDSPRRDPATGLNESAAATAFYWMSEGKRSPVDLRAAQADLFDNRLDVLCKTFQGVTISCARCHDHKFDPITQADYYGLYGYLKSSRYTQTMLNAAEVNARAAELRALRGQIREAAGAALGAEASGVSRYLAAAERVRGAAGPAAEAVKRAAAEAGLDAGRLGRWVAAVNEPAADPAHPLFAWRRVAELGASAPPAAVAARWREVRSGAMAHAEAAARASRREGDVELTADFAAAGYRGWFPEDQAFGPAPLRPGDFLLGADAARPVLTFVRGGAWAHGGYLSRKLQGTLRSPEVTIDRRYLHVYAAGRASRVNVIIDGFVMIQDPLYGRLRHVLNDEGAKWITFDLAMWKGRRVYVEFADTTTQDLHDMGAPAGCGPEGYVALGRVVLSDAGAPAPIAPTPVALALGDGPVESPAALAERYGQTVRASLAAFARGELADAPDAEARAALLAWLVEHNLLAWPASGSAEAGRLRGLFEQFRQVEARLPEPLRAPGMTDGTAQDECVFLRGNPKNAGPIVPRRMPRLAAGGLADGATPPAPGAGSGRLDLARRFADPANPLTARVMVNRVWHHLFGRGIVPSVDNFGAMGEPPSHPELLDYLADRFVKEGWSVKKLARELVLSSTFRMAARADPAADAADPDNRLLHRMAVRRLEAEAIRDAILCVSGRLNREVGGPGVEVHVTPFMDTYAATYGKPPTNGPLDGDGRRSLYLRVRRNFLVPLLAAFDSPPPLNTAGRRGVSNVPAQALILMNDPFVAGEARRWAGRIVSRKELDPAGRARRMYLEAYGRPPTEAETATALRFLRRQAEVYAEESGLPPERRADDERVWADFAHVLMNVKEFIFLD